MKSSNTDFVEESIVNPFYVITLKDELFGAHDLEGAKEDWVLKNVQLIEEIGSKDWLGELLLALSPKAKPDYVRDVLVNPYKGIIYSDRLKGEHEPLVTRDMWIGANIKMIEELGADAWLWGLLNVLETGGPKRSA
jgi:hypothetical protein